LEKTDIASNGRELIEFDSTSSHTLVMIRTEGLSRVVQAVRVHRALVSADQLQHVEHLPDGTIALLFRIMQESRCHGDLSVVGTRTRALYKTVTPVPLAVAIRFPAGAASAILGVPANELTNRVVSLEELWGSEALRLHDTLLSTRGVAAIVELLQQAVSARAVRLDERRSMHLVHAAIRRIEQSAAPVRVARLAADLGVTSRHSVERSPRPWESAQRSLPGSSASSARCTWRR
jgi:hypothetical protein